MRTSLDIEWEEHSVFLSEPSEIPKVGDTLKVDYRESDGKVSAWTPTLRVMKRHFHYYSSGASQNVQVTLDCELDGI
jgi:hypothetical protein